MGKFEQKVALITGAGRGQGRSHAVEFAKEGASLVLCDLDGDLASPPYGMSRWSDLEETVALVEAAGGRAISAVADVRDTAALADLVDEGIDRFGQIDIAVANAGIAGISTVAEMSDRAWEEMIGVNLTGVFKTLRAVSPHMVERGYGRIVATASVVARQGSPNIAHYVAAKWGVVGLVKSLALEVADSGVTVNAVCPTSVDTPMIQNEAFHDLFLPGQDEYTLADVERAYTELNPIPIPWVQPEDISDAVLFLASDEARFITGEALPVALGWNARTAA
ncbi:MAG TPA: mycofactocin-coupled SDR family oxidoreductase [Solirubrobacterales bacterium]|nr:mycofactocin-coupled SDR family oxidoreductase [Solirubrobacterales bacterium]